MRGFDSKTPPQAGETDGQGQEIRHARQDRKAQGKMIAATHHANQWHDGQFWGYVILLADATRQELAAQEQSDLDWLIEGTILTKLLNDSCPAGNA